MGEYMKQANYGNHERPTVHGMSALFTPVACLAHTFDKQDMNYKPINAGNRAFIVNRVILGKTIEFQKPGRYQQGVHAAMDPVNDVPRAIIDVNASAGYQFHKTLSSTMPETRATSRVGSTSTTTSTAERCRSSSFTCTT